MYLDNWHIRIICYMIDYLSGAVQSTSFINIKFTDDYTYNWIIEPVITRLSDITEHNDCIHTRYSIEFVRRPVVIKVIATATIAYKKLLLDSVKELYGI